MTTKLININEDCFNKVFPFSVRLDSKLNIIGIGDVIASLLKTPKLPTSFSEIFRLKHPNIELTYSNIIDTLFNLVIIILKKNGLNIKGEFITSSNNEEVLFIGSPILTEVKECQRFGLQIDSFSAHDSTVDLLLSHQSSLTALTDAKKLNKKLKENEQSLEEKNMQLIQQSEELEKANQLVRLALEAKNEFLASMSHEIRTPMNGIMGMLELLKDTELSDKQKRFTEVAYHSAETLLSIINDILDYTKLEAGRVQLESIAFDIRKEIIEVIDLMSINACKKNIYLTSVFDASIPKTLLGDPTRIRQIIVNLVSNAIKFTSDGGDIEVKLVCTAQDEHAISLKLVVIDTGIGIPQSAYKQIFKTFTQVDRSIVRRFGGTGLGLAICKRLVTAMNGTISVESIVNSGTTFTVELQLKQLNAEQAQHPWHTSLARKKILLISTDKRTSSIETLLHNWNVDIKHQSDRPIPSDINHYDLVILDAQIKDFEDIACSIKSSVPIIAIYDNKIDGLKYTNIKFFLRKPVRQQGLFNCICDILLTDNSNNQPAETEAHKITHQPSMQLDILVVDDSKVNRLVIEQMLLKLNCTVDCVENGRDAVMKSKNKKYDLIFMDIHMPVMDGFSATKEIRRLKTDNQVKIIALTANILQETKKKCFDCGMDSFIAKPFKFDDIKEIISTTAHSHN